MNPIRGLLKKDYRLSKSYFFIWLGAVTLLLIGGAAFAIYKDIPIIPTFILGMTGMSLVLFSPIFMLSLLNMEGKTQLWLYTPRASYTLFLSKIIVISIYQLVVQMVLTIYGTWYINTIGTSIYELLDYESFVILVVLANVILFFTGAYFTCWIIFYWTLYHTMKKNPKLRTYRWLAIVVIYFSYNILEAILIQLKPVQNIIFLYQWDLPINPQSSYQMEKWSLFFETVPLPIIPIVYYAVLAIILFIIGSKLLERKVEV